MSPNFGTFDNVFNIDKMYVYDILFCDWQIFLKVHTGAQ